MKIRAGAFNSDMAQAMGVNIVRLHAGVCVGGGVGVGRRHVDCTAVQRLPEHGFAGADHVFCGGGDWRHRLRSWRIDRRVVGGLGRHLWQSAVAAIRQHAGVCVDGLGLALQTRRLVQTMSTPQAHLETLPAVSKYFWFGICGLVGISFC
jgi:hypothetical protein